MYLNRSSLFLIFFFQFAFLAGQPLNRSLHLEPVNMGDKLLRTSISGSWLMGGSVGQYMGYPSFKPWLALADEQGDLLWERILNDAEAVELGRVSALCEDALGEAFYVAGPVSGCDYLIPGYLYMLDKQGQTLWFKATELFYNPIATALPLQGVLVGEKWSGMIEWHTMSGELSVGTDFSSEFGLQIEDMITTGLNTVAILGRNQIILTEWTDGEVNLLSRLLLENGKSIARTAAGGLAVLAGEKAYLLDSNLDIIQERNLATFGTFEKVSCNTAGRCYVAGQSPEGRYISLALDEELQYQQTIDMGPNYNYPSDMVALEEGLAVIGTAHPKESSDAPFAWPNTFTTSKGSDIFLRSWDEDGTAAASQRNISVEEVAVNQAEVSSFPGGCAISEDSHIRGYFSGIDVHIRNEGNSIIDRVVLSTVFETCWLICYTQQNISRTYEGLSLAPGESATLSFGDIQTWPLPLSEEIQLCIWASGPDGQLDDDFDDNNACFSVLVSDKEVEKAFEGVAVFPNPATSILEVRFGLPLTEDAEVSIANALGQQLYRAPVSAGRPAMQIPVEQLPAGLHYLIIQGRQGKEAISWIKQ